MCFKEITLFHRRKCPTVGLNALGEKDIRPIAKYTPYDFQMFYTLLNKPKLTKVVYCETR